MTHTTQQIHLPHFRELHAPERRLEPTAVQPKEVFMINVRKLLVFGLCILPSHPAVAQSIAPGAHRQQLSGHVTTEMREAALEGRVPPTTQLTLTVGLVIRNAAELAETAAQVSDPPSPSYRKYLTPKQFADRFGVTPEDYQSVLDWAKSNNLTATAHGNRFVVTVEGSVADIEPALNVHLNNYLRQDGSMFFAPDSEPSVTLPVPVEHIGGLDNFVVPANAGGSGAGGTYQGTDFRNAYAPQMTLTGKGQKIGIFMLDGFAQSDINGYATQTGQSYLAVQVVPSSAVLTPGVEGTLDVEAALSMAPAAQVVAFVGSNQTTILTDMSDRTDILQFTSSWFWAVALRIPTSCSNSPRRASLSSRQAETAEPTRRPGFQPTSAAAWMTGSSPTSRSWVEPTSI